MCSAHRARPDSKARTTPLLPPPSHTHAHPHQCGSLLFVALLGSGARVATAAPVANATALAANALADAALGEARYDWRLLAPGLALVAGGLLLCATAA